MVFPSVEFALFFPAVLALSWLLMPRPRLWKPFILAAGALFYAAADWRFCLLLAAVALVNQGAARVVRTARTATATATASTARASDGSRAMSRTRGTATYRSLTSACVER